MKRLKYLVSLILCAALAMSCLMIPALALEKRYNSNWVYWSQGASGIGGYMNNCGCRIVADAKLLKEAGIAPASFDPDIYAQWANRNGYYGDKRPLSAYVGEQSVGGSQGKGPEGYARAQGKTLYYCNQINFTSASRTARVNQVMDWLQDGYYVILGCGTHHAYVGREMSLSKGTPYVLDSGSSYISGPITAYKDYPAARADFSYARLYSITPGKVFSSGSAVTLGADTITQTSAILRGSVSSTGAKMTQCGMLLGTTVENMTLLGKDSINTYGTTCFYSTSKYGRTLTPGTTYYYQAYAVVDGKEYKGNVRSFRTTGTSTPTEPTLTATATTGTATNITHDSALFSGSFSASSAVTLKQFGVLLGKTQSTMLKYPDTTKANLTTTSCSFQLSAANFGIKLEPNTTYYYCTYAFFGDAGRMGEIRSFKTPASPQMPSQPTPTPHVSISLSQSSMTIQDNVCKNLSVTTTPANLAVTWKSSNPSVATVNKGAVTGLKAGTTTITASVSYNGQTASASCVVTVEASKKPCNHVKGKYLWYAAVHPHYDHYQCAICGETYRGTTTNIMPTCEICCPINAYGIRLSGLSATNITANSVRLNASCTYAGSRPTSVGVYLGTTPTNIQIKGSDGNINHNKNPFDIWYNLNGLTTGTTYYYRFYAVVDGKTSYSEIKSFTTK